MAFLVALTGDRALAETFAEVLTERHALMVVPSWRRLESAVESLPVTGVILDGGLVDRSGPGVTAVRRLIRRFPSVGLTLVSDRCSDPLVLFRLGRLGVQALVHLPAEEISVGLLRAVGRSLARSPEALVSRVVSSYLPAAERKAVRLAVEAAERRWRTRDVARRVGLTRPHLSVRLRSHGLPSLGRLLVWGRLLHAGAWLTDPGRSAESVSRQLGYANGSVFRRALRNYLGATPTEVRRGGGLDFVLDHFVDRCDLRNPFVSEDRTAA